MPLSESEREELRTLAGSDELREDMARLAASKTRFFLREGSADPDRAIAFLCAYNRFINHGRRRFQRIIDNVMKL